MKKMLVVGSGLMGSGIALVSAKAGFDVTVVERSATDLENGLDRMKKMISSLIKKEVWADEDRVDIWNRIHGATELEAGKDVDLVIEAVPERLPLKQAVFRELDQVINKEAILASNSSSLSISAIGGVTQRPEKVIGMHFFSPVPVMKLLELVYSLNTSKETLRKVKIVGEKMGKSTIIAKDFPGFTVNRVLVPMMNEAIYLAMEGNEPEEIDRGLELGANHPVGPLRLADYVGLDVLLFTLESLYEGFNDSKYRPCPLLKRMVEAGQLGKKTGQGFYSYKR